MKVFELHAHTCGCQFAIQDTSEWVIEQKCNRHQNIDDTGIYQVVRAEQDLYSEAHQFIDDKIPKERLIQNESGSLVRLDVNTKQPIFSLPFVVDDKGYMTFIASNVLLPEEMGSEFNLEANRLFGDRVIFV